MTSEYKTHQGRIKWKPGRAIHYAALAFRNPSLIKKRKYMFIISHFRWTVPTAGKVIEASVAPPCGNCGWGFIIRTDGALPVWQTKR